MPAARRRCRAARRGPPRPTTTACRRRPAPRTASRPIDQARPAAPPRRRVERIGRHGERRGRQRRRALEQLRERCRSAPRRRCGAAGTARAPAPTGARSRSRSVRRPRGGRSAWRDARTRRGRARARSASSADNSVVFARRVRDVGREATMRGTLWVGNEPRAPDVPAPWFDDLRRVVAQTLCHGARCARGHGREAAEAPTSYRGPRGVRRASVYPCATSVRARVGGRAGRAVCPTREGLERPRREESTMNRSAFAFVPQLPPAVGAPSWPLAARR